MAATCFHLVAAVWAFALFVKSLGVREDGEEEKSTTTAGRMRVTRLGVRKTVVGY